LEKIGEQKFKFLFKMAEKEVEIDSIQRFKAGCQPVRRGDYVPIPNLRASQGGRVARRDGQVARAARQKNEPPAGLIARKRLRFGRKAY
jgi:hypothetical protein